MSASEEATLRALDDLRQLAGMFSLSLADVLRQKADELRVREHIRRIPNSFIKERQYISYLKAVLGRSPTLEELDGVRVDLRRPTLGRLSVEFQVLLSQQNERCALCGAKLMGGRLAEVDHVVPLSLGGKNDVSNYQLLCVVCNRDKGQLLGWVMGAPFFCRFTSKGVASSEISRKVRYCALVRDRSACQVPLCLETSRTSVLCVDLVIPRNAGGRPVFDNVTTRCERHRAEMKEERFNIAVQELAKGCGGVAEASRKKLPSFAFLNDMQQRR